MHTANKNNHNDNPFKATVVLPTAMTYSVGSSSSMSDSNEWDIAIDNLKTVLDPVIYMLQRTQKIDSKLY